jgi:hypothetical protein
MRFQASKAQASEVFALIEAKALGYIISLSCQHVHTKTMAKVISSIYCCGKLLVL